jgi:lambda family phage tail tape measure protein
LSLAEQLRVDIAEGKLGSISNQARDYLIALADAADDARKKIEKAFVGPDIPVDILERRKKLTNEINQILASTPTAKLEQERAVLRELTDLYEQGRFGLVGSTEAIEAYGEAAQTALGTLPQQWRKATDQMDEFTRQAARNIQDALGDTVLRTLKGNFDSIGELWLDLIQRMIAQALSARLAEALMGDFAKSGNVGGWLGDLFGFLGLAKGGVFQGGVQTFGSGGVVTSPHLFPMARGMGLMGEAGPEAIMPLQRGRDGRLGVAAQGGGGVTVINNVAAGVSRNEVLSLLQLTAQSLRGEFKQSLRLAGVA